MSRRICELINVMVNKQSKGNAKSVATVGKEQRKIKIGGASDIQATNCLFQIHHSLNNQDCLLGIVLSLKLFRFKLNRFQ